MEKILFLLGLIRNTDMYGYQINELIDSHFDLIVNITKPTAYRLLSKMAEDGWIVSRQETIGNRPPRKIYSITPQGERAFQELLHQSLVEYNPTSQSSAISLAFLHFLPADEVLPLLQARRERVQHLLGKLTQSQDHQSDFGVMFENQRRHIETELAWIEELISNLG